MKTLLCILLVIPSITFSQVGLSPMDSLKQRILNIEEEHNAVKLNLQAHKKEFALGTALLATGAILVLVDGLSEEDPDKEKDRFVTYIGAGLMTVGVAIQIDSHKWIGRAGFVGFKRRRLLR